MHIFRSPVVSAAFRGASTKSSATVVSVVQREVPLGSASAFCCARAIMETATVMVPTRAMRGAQRRSLTEELEHSRCHRHEEQQHGDVGWTEPTITPPRGRSQLSFFNAFEFEDERHGVLMLCDCPTRWAQRWRVRETACPLLRHALKALLGGK